MPLSPLESRLRYEFRNAELLRQALTHRSHSASHNERLEFLGDSVLNCAVAALLFQRFGKLDEGDLSRVRANLVKQQSLYEIAQALNISEGLRLGEGELRSGGFRRPSILADAFEAILGAIFVDGGFDAAQAVIKRLYVPILDHIDPRTLGKDSKTLLQEYLQGHKIALPTYTVVATHGAAHNQQFEVECTVPKLDIKVSGSGASRRAAEQAAAKKALDEVVAQAPAMEVKPKRSRGARTGKHGEPDVVPGVKGVQAALDLRSPERKADKSGRVESKASQPEAAEQRAATTHPAVIRASHVDHKPGQRGLDGAAAKAEAAGKGEAATAKGDGIAKGEASAKADATFKADAAGKGDAPFRADAAGKGDAPFRADAAANGDAPSTADASLTGDPSSKPDQSFNADASAKGDLLSKADASAQDDAVRSARPDPATRDGTPAVAAERGDSAELVSDVTGSTQPHAAKPDHS
ncbi:MAG TPA: ribonuclease III [Trinickia sp.]|nr:ribonuclease III [Trinickia sp.]